MLKQEPVRGVVFRDGEPTLVQEKHVKQTDSSLYADPRPPCAPDEMVAIARERDRLVKIIRDFCDGQDWAAETWKAQAHIKPLFDAAKGAKL